MPGVADRFRAAAAAEPLSALGPGAREELAAVLAAAREFDELPGRWQAALLHAEAGADAPPSGGGCCHAHPAT